MELSKLFNFSKFFVDNVQPAEPFSFILVGPNRCIFFPDASYLVGLFPAVDLGFDILPQIIGNMNSNSIEHRTILERLVRRVNMPNDNACKKHYRLEVVLK